ncbi:MAG: aminopeptidase [Gemmatimonadetes bacterium]|nr:aminopeptidase [Gemmatimonadota bacterium]MYB97372.1 aminopeptidase [Gemmatimonadota bacterium]MYI46497.1 aminopeptidase [Gemmatimonadota bacterium]
MSSVHSVKRRPWLKRVAVVIAALFVAIVAVSVGTGCSPVYVIKAGWAEAKILKARRPLPEVILAPETDERTRGKLTLAREAREFAINGLKLDVGDSYTTYIELDRDTLAMVLSAAYQDRLASRTWWFPIVGHVPYRGFFDLEDALEEQRKLDDEGFDTLLRPTSAFSTLGWFSDPLLSTIVRYDEVELITTILHELSHNDLFVPGQVRFNESFATWVGRTGAIEFFCARPGGGPDTVWCNRARDRWHDVLLFSRFIDLLVEELEDVYGDSVTTRETRIARRQAVFEEHQRRLREELRPRFRSLTFSGFDALPLNNAILLSRMLYYHRLPDFEAHLEQSGGSLQAAIETLRTGTESVEDPFDLLPVSGNPAPPGL